MRKVFYIIVLIALCHCKEQKEKSVFCSPSFELITTQETYAAATPIQLKFKSTQEAFLNITNAFGTTVLIPEMKDGLLCFKFPKPFTTKAGSCAWNLIYNQKTYHQGTLTILPNTEKGINIASYLGPRSITAGGTDFSMFVVSPTDIYDNPIVDSTAVNTIYQFDTTIKKNTVYAKNGISWKNIKSPEKTGRILVTASCLENKSKEMTTIVYPALPEDFKIDYSRNHPYADGNQIISISTDVIRDRFQNIISDGTLVNFSIINSMGRRLETIGTTIGGKATGQLLHPEKAEKWNVTAYISGAAKSKPLFIEFKSAVKNFNVSFSDDGRKITLNAIQSFMEQWVPDGLTVKLKLMNQNGDLITAERTSTRLGKASFELPDDFYENGTYELTIEIAGIIKKQKLSLK